MAAQIGEAAFQRFEVLRAEVGFGHAAVALERANRRHEHDRAGHEIRHAALDIDEFFRAEVCAEARLRHHNVCQTKRRLRGDHRVAAVRDVGERAAVNERGRADERLHEVRAEGVFEQRRRRALRVDISRGHGLVVIGAGDDNAGDARLEIRNGGSETKRRHDFAGSRDVKPIFARRAVGLAAQTV